MFEGYALVERLQEMAGALDKFRCDDMLFGDRAPDMQGGVDDLAIWEYMQAQHFVMCAEMALRKSATHQQRALVAFHQKSG